MILRIFVLSLLAVTFAATAALADTASVQIAWRMLDYIAVDYPEAVHDGAVVSESEFAEMTEFATSARLRIAELPASGAQPDLLQRAEVLETLIADRASASAVAAAARALAADLIKEYPVPLTPAEPPDFSRGRKLFVQNCVSCHGVNGDGNGPASPGLVPPPIAFTDKDRARERSIFALYQIIEQGISGTSMAGYAEMPPSDRWDLAVYTSAFAYPTSAADEGERLWKEDAALRYRIDLEQFISQTPASLAAEIGETNANAVTAYLRHNPTAVIEPATGPLTRAFTRLDEALTAYANGDRKTATDLALSAYLDGFEPVEPILTLRSNALKTRIETAMGELRACLAQQRPLDQVRQQTDALKRLLNEAEATLAARNASTGSSFFGAFTILLREGLEAILIIVAMLAFLQKTGRRDAIRYVHAGWITSLAAGGLTWAVGTYLVGISGASRELMEGFGSVLAAIILLWVGIWMHGKSNAQAWQRYVCDQMTLALKRRSAWFLFGLSFVVVYREIFETILFYAAIWNHGNAQAVVAGSGAAAVVLLVVAVLMLRYGRTLPIEKFFAYSAGLIALLAIVLTGKGVAALQEAGYLPVHPLATFPRLEILGLFPTLEGIVAPLAMILFLAIGFTYNHRRSQLIQSRAG